MVAALKMRRAQEQTLQTRPYTGKATQILANLIQWTQINQHPLFTYKQPPEGEKEKLTLLLITPNRGLCGSLTTNLFRELFSFTAKPEEKEIAYITYGKRGRDFITIQNLMVLADFEAPEPPRFEKAVDLLRILKDGFLTGKFQRVYLVYTHFSSTMKQTPVILPLLPLSKDISVIGGGFFPEEKRELEKSTFNFEYLFEPQASILLESFLPHFLEMKIYHALLEAYASEQSARMMAMRTATENAREIMAELTLSYNKERQQVITNEISDIVTAQLGLEAR